MKLIKLANDETLNLSINFLTLKTMRELGLMKVDFKSVDPEVQVDIITKLIYSIMFANGKKLTMDDALALVPIGNDDAFMEIFAEFGEQMEAFQKKTEARSNLSQLTK